MCVERLHCSCSYIVGGSQPYTLAARLPAFYLWRLLSLTTASKPKVVACRQVNVVPCLGSQQCATPPQAAAKDFPQIIPLFSTLIRHATIQRAAIRLTTIWRITIRPTKIWLAIIWRAITWRATTWRRAAPPQARDPTWVTSSSTKDTPGGLRSWVKGVEAVCVLAQLPQSTFHPKAVFQPC